MTPSERPPEASFAHAALASPVMLAVNAAYYLARQETGGADSWYDSNTTVTVSTAGTASAATWSDLTNWYFTGGAGSTFVPANFKYETGGVSSDGD